MKEKNKKSKFNIIGLLKNKKVLAIILFIIFIYILYAVYLLIKDPTDTFTVEEGTVSSEESAVGYVIRDEMVIKGENYKNGMIQIASEGQRVAKGENVFRYYSKNENDLTEKIQKLDEEIQQALANETDLYSPDIKQIEKEIDEKTEQLSNLRDTQKIEEYKKDISKLITKKAEMVGDLSSSGSYIKKLIKERSEYENKLNSGAEYITTPESGIISYKVDGLEEVLNPNDFSNITKEKLEDLNLKTGKIISSSEEAGKIINNFECYIATIITDKKKGKIEIGNTVKIRLSSGKELDAEIVYISQEENEDEVLIIFELDQLPEDLIDYRKISFDIIWWSYSGLKVPNQAIVEKDDKNYVVRNRAGYLSKLLVKVLKQNDKYSIVTTYSTEELKELGLSNSEINSYKKITIYDEILLNPNLDKAG